MKYKYCLLLISIALGCVTATVSPARIFQKNGQQAPDPARDRVLGEDRLVQLAELLQRGLLVLQPEVAGLAELRRQMGDDPVVALLKEQMPHHRQPQAWEELQQIMGLSGTEVTDTTLRHLKRLKNLRKVYVWQTAVTEEKAKELMEDMDQLEVNTGWKAPPPSEKKEEEKKAETATVADAKAGSKPVNGKCPVSGKDIDAEKLVTYKGNVIAFCCDMCKGKFEADPEKFIAKVDGFKAEEAKPAAEAKPADAPKPEAKAKKGKGKGKKKKD